VRVNIAVRTAEGIHGPIILAAYCPTCQQEAMPMANNTCGWCDTPIIGPPGTPAPALKPKPKLRGPNVTEHDIAVALRREAARLGRTPYSREWQRENLSPSSKTIFRRFGTWDAALEAAGLA
jgi:hypothetical protein